MLRETVSAMQKRLSTQATSVGVNGDYFAVADGRPSGILLRDGVLATPPNSAALERRSHARRPARRSEGQLPRHLAGSGSAARAELPEQGAGDERHLALHAGLGSRDAARPGCVHGRARRVPSGDAEHGSRRSGDDGRRRDVDADRAGNRGPRRARECCSEAAGGGAAGKHRHASAHPSARLVGRLGCDRRRPGARAGRRAGLPLERGLHHVSARSARPANGRRPARGRRHRVPHHRRTAAGPLGRDDELRARAGARPLRRRAWDGAGRRRVVDARFRGNRAELAVRRTRARRLRPR